MKSNALCCFCFPPLIVDKIGTLKKCVMQTNCSNSNCTPWEEYIRLLSTMLKQANTKKKLL